MKISPAAEFAAHSMVDLRMRPLSNADFCSMAETMIQAAIAAEVKPLAAHLRNLIILAKMQQSITGSAISEYLIALPTAEAALAPYEVK